MTAKTIREDLLNQLALQGKNQDYYKDLVNDYMSYYKLKRDLQKDIKEKGIWVESQSGNGFKTKKFNDSVKEVQKVTSTMLKILSELGLREPAQEDTSDDDYLT